MTTQALMGTFGSRGGESGRREACGPKLAEARQRLSGLLRIVSRSRWRKSAGTKPEVCAFLSRIGKTFDAASVSFSG